MSSRIGSCRKLIFQTPRETHLETQKTFYLRYKIKLKLIQLDDFFVKANTYFVL